MRLLKSFFAIVALALFLSIPSPVYAIDQTNSDANKVIGQPDFNQNINYRKGLWYPTSIHAANGKLYVSEYGTCRVLGYNNIPTTNHPSGDFAIGKNSIDFECINYGQASSTHNGESKRVFASGGKFFILDGGQNRVLIYNTIPTTFGAAADVVLGQPNFTTATVNTGGISANSLNIAANPSSSGDLYVYDNKLFVADSQNNRVLIWNSIPTVNATPADVVLGQPSFTTNTANNGGISASSLNSPRGVFVYEGKLYVSDTSNNRILVWNTIPTVNNTPANVVFGQPNFTSNTANNGGISATSLYSPAKLNIQDGKLFVPDLSNNRLLIWNTVPTANGVPADLVLGQPNFTSNAVNNGGVSASSLNTPIHSLIINGSLYVVDNGNSRIKIYNAVPTTNNVSADIVIGQSNLSQSWIKNGGVDVFNTQYHTMGSDGKLVVADAFNNRILIWNSIPTVQYPLIPDVILGQPNLSSNIANNGGISATSLMYPYNPSFCGNKLLVADYANQRILIWNNLPASNNTPADVVLGQPNFTTNTQNYGGLSASSLRWPMSAICIGEKLVANDYNNRRILIWNTIPTTNFTPADVVLGQPNFTSAVSNNGGVSAKSLILGSGNITTNGTNLIAVDQYNHRVLIWNTVPTTNFAEADLVLGQPDFTSNTMNNGGLSSRSMNYPAYVFFDGQRLLISDGGNNRVLGFNTIPTSNFAEADFVIGQADFTSNITDISINRVRAPRSITTLGDRIYVSDNNDRIIAFPFGPQETAVEAPAKTTVRDITVTLSARGAKEMLVSTSSDFAGAAWEAFNTTKSLQIPAGDGQKQVYVKYKDYANYEGEVLSATTVLDTTGPQGKLIILSPTANGYVTSSTVTLKINGTDALSNVTQMMIANDKNFTGATWESYATTKNWTLTAGDGQKAVYIKFKDETGNESDVYTSGVTVDTTTNVSIVKVNEQSFTATETYKVTSKPKLSGTGEPDSQIMIKWGEKIVGEVTVGSNGNWEWQPSSELGNGNYGLMLVIQDEAGNTSTQAVTLEVTGNTTDTKNTDINYPTVTPSPTATELPVTESKTTQSNLWWYVIAGILILAILLFVARRRQE